MEFALATLTLRVDELARRVGIRVDAWEVEGLGPARGAALRLASGRPMLLQELQFPIETGASSGPDVWVDATDLAALGVDDFLTEVMQALDVGRDAVDWVQNASVRNEAACRADWARAYRQARDRGLPLPDFPLSNSDIEPPIEPPAV